jgi:predicted RNase H-like nuclease (RuvC/YqgF family)
MLPILDFLFLLLLVVFSTTGLKWLSSDSLPVGSSALAESLSLEDMKKTIDELRLHNDELSKELLDLGGLPENLQERLDAMDRQRSVAQTQPAPESVLRDLSGEISDFKSEISSLGDLPDNAAKVRDSLTSARDLLRAAEDELRSVSDEIERTRCINEELQREISEYDEARRAKHLAVEVNGLSYVKYDATRNPVFVAILGGRIIPLKEPFYRFENTVQLSGNGTLEVVRKASCVKDGETTEQAFQEGSAFEGEISDISPSKEYLALLVDPESFDAYRTVRDTLRKRGIPYGWIPVQNGDFCFGSSGTSVPVNDQNLKNTPTE